MQGVKGSQLSIPRILDALRWKKVAEEFYSQKKMTSWPFSPVVKTGWQNQGVFGSCAGALVTLKPGYLSIPIF